MAAVGGVVAHLAFDGSGVAPAAARLVADLEDFLEEEFMEAWALLRGETLRR